VENRNWLIAAAMVTHVGGSAERNVALLILVQNQEGRKRRITVGADKANTPSRERSASLG